MLDPRTLVVAGHSGLAEIGDPTVAAGPRRSGRSRPIGSPRPHRPLRRRGPLGRVGPDGGIVAVLPNRRDPVAFDVWLLDLDTGEQP